MCLILFAVQQHPAYPLVIAANRDEFFHRETVPAQFWDTYPNLYAGQDQLAGGTWLGINRSGMFAALTNFREPSNTDNSASDYTSRGELAVNYLKNEQGSVEQYLNNLVKRDHEYNGYNLLVGDAKQLGYHSNRNAHQSKLKPGTYGLSNGLLDTPWPKVVSGKDALTHALQHANSSSALAEQLFSTLYNDQQAEDPHLPDTGIGIEWERALSPRFIKGEVYGTRCSTVVIYHQNQSIEFYERNFAPNGILINQSKEIFPPS